MQSPFVCDIRGKGLLNAIEIDQVNFDVNAWDLCMEMSSLGLLAKPTHGNIIRFAPPLVITDEEMSKCLDILQKVLVNNNRMIFMIFEIYIYIFEDIYVYVGMWMIYMDM